MIDARKGVEKKEERYDLFSSLLDANDGESDGTAKLSDDELMGNIFIYLIAGHEVGRICCWEILSAHVVGHRVVNCTYYRLCIHHARSVSGRARKIVSTYHECIPRQRIASKSVYSSLAKFHQTQLCADI